MLAVNSERLPLWNILINKYNHIITFIYEVYTADRMTRKDTNLSMQIRETLVAYGNLEVGISNSTLEMMI